MSGAETAWPIVVEEPHRRIRELGVAVADGKNPHNQQAKSIRLQGYLCSIASLGKSDLLRKICALRRNIRPLGGVVLDHLGISADSLFGAGLALPRLAALASFGSIEQRMTAKAIACPARID